MTFSFPAETSAIAANDANLRMSVYPQKPLRSLRLMRICEWTFFPLGDLCDRREIKESQKGFIGLRKVRKSNWQIRIIRSSDRKGLPVKKEKGHQQTRNIRGNRKGLLEER